MIDDIIAILILSILLAIAIKTYQPYLKIARLTQTIGGSPFTDMKMQMIFYRAHTGEWPKDNQQTLSFGSWEGHDVDLPAYVKEAKIDDGAIHFSLDQNFQGKTVTLRPAVPADDLFGPVIWVCGDRDPSSGWLVHGVDRTDVDEKYIHSSWR